MHHLRPPFKIVTSLRSKPPFTFYFQNFQYSKSEIGKIFQHKVVRFWYEFWRSESESLATHSAKALFWEQFQKFAFFEEKIGKICPLLEKNLQFWGITSTKISTFWVKISPSLLIFPNPYFYLAKYWPMVGGQLKTCWGQHHDFLKWPK